MMMINLTHVESFSVTNLCDSVEHLIRNVGFVLLGAIHVFRMIVKAIKEDK